ncbi:uncharacterized protein [Clytia hemisphaerica]|uniref:G-protein coupled receptors family 1 profile domain-containing protein n=1 Tax=Clytia hemisphaerica TaxID=252671 RepID=A0A7M5X5F1_9CNID
MRWRWDHDSRETMHTREVTMTNWSITKTILTNLPLLFYSIAVILHSIGITLLLKLRRKRNQDIIILHLSITELFMCLLDIIQNILSRDDYVTEMTSRVKSYVIIVNCCFFVVPSFLIIITLTIDRFLEIYLNIKYQLYFSKKKLKFVLTVHWVLGSILGAALLVVRLTHGTQARLVIFMFIFPTLEIIFLIIAIVTYAYIYRKFRSKFKRLFIGKVTPVKKDLDNSNLEGEAKSPYGIELKGQTSPIKRYSVWKGKLTRARKLVITNVMRRPSNKEQQKPMLKRRNFFAPSLILVTFVLFVVIPDSLNLLFHYSKTLHWSEDTQNILLCLYSIGFIMDGLIYIFLQKHLRVIFWKLFSRRKWVQHVTSTSMHGKSAAAGGDIHKETSN